MLEDAGIDWSHRSTAQVRASHDLDLFAVRQSEKNIYSVKMTEPMEI